MLRKKMRVPNKLAMNTAAISETPNHSGNDGICTITRKMQANRDTHAEQDHELHAQAEFVHATHK